MQCFACYNHKTRIFTIEYAVCGVFVFTHNVESFLTLRNSSLKLKTVVDNAILLNYAVSSGNISERMKIQTSTQMSVNSEDF